MAHVVRMFNNASTPTLALPAQGGGGRKRPLICQGIGKRKAIRLLKNGLWGHPERRKEFQACSDQEMLCFGQNDHIGNG
jgi:hypothetical protein